MASMATSSSYSSSSSSSITLSMIRKPPTTSFYNGGAGALKLEVVRVVAPSTNQHQSRRQRGAALVARMSLFGRFAMVIKSYANSIMSSFEDPERILEQAVLEMNGDLTKMRQATAQVMASRKRLENKHQAAQQASENWYRKAQLALRQGEEDLAREALRRRKTHADDASSLKAQLDQQKGVVDNLVMNTRLLESKIQESMSKKDTLKARFRSAKIASEVSEMVGNVDTSSALLAFAKMEEKVLTMEALGQVSMNDLEGKFAMLESSSFVEDDLENLKKQLSVGSNLKKKKGELPPGRSVVAAASNNGAYLLKDCEIDMELNKLRTAN